MTPAEEITTAVTRLRKLAAEATPAPWTWQRWHSDTCPTNCDDPTCFLLIVGSPYGPVGDADVDRDVFAVERSVHERGESDAAYIAAMHPGIGELLAKWLASWQGIDFSEAAALPEDAQHAIAIARAINGTGGEQP